MPHGRARRGYGQRGQHLPVGRRDGDKEVTDADQGQAGREDLGPAVLEYVNEKAAAHAGGAARQLANAVEETGLDRVQPQADVDGRDQDQEATAVHVLQGMGSDHGGGHDRVLGPLGPVFRRGFSARCYLCHRLHPLLSVSAARFGIGRGTLSIRIRELYTRSVFVKGLLQPVAVSAHGQREHQQDASLLGQQIV